MAKQKTFGKGAFATGSNVVSSQTVSIPTSVVSLPKTKYGQSGGGKRKKRR